MAPGQQEGSTLQRSGSQKIPLGEQRRVDGGYLMIIGRRRSKNCGLPNTRTSALRVPSTCRRKEEGELIAQAWPCREPKPNGRFDLPGAQNGGMGAGRSPDNKETSKKSLQGVTR